MPKNISRLCRLFKINGVGVDLSKFYPRSRFEREELRHEYGLGTEEFIITNVAEINRNKNQMMLVKHLPELKKCIRNIRVLFIGQDNYHEVRKLVKRLDLENIVTFLGYRHDVDILTSISDIGFSASFREGLPVNIIEAMACGIPVICSNIRGHIDTIVSGINGFLFHLNAPKEMVNLMIRLYNNPILRQKISFNNIEDVKKFSVEKSVMEMASIYDSVIQPE